MLGFPQKEKKMTPILREEDAKDWAYKGEGAANLVVSYQGSSPSLIGKVLRIQKVPKGREKSMNGCLVLSKNEQILWGNFEELVEATSNEIAGQVYMDQVMSPLLDPKYIDGGIRINVSSGFLESVEKNVHGVRPVERIDAAEIDVHCDSALLISDHSLFERSKASCPVSLKRTCASDVSFTVEIKPKCGFLPSSEFIAKENAFKKHITRFRMHQLLKLHKGEISQISTYDPLDLFSRSKDRVCQAINGLFTTPGNNFRIFSNGSLVFGGLGGSIDMTVVSSKEEIVKIESLIKDSGLKVPSFIELIAEILLKSRVLDKLLAAQKLDSLDIEGSIHLYYNIISEPCIACKDIRDVELLSKYSLLHSFSLEESIKIVREYLVAATAKDCSLMISFRPVDGGDITTVHDSIFLESCNRIFSYKANFIDLDLRSLDKMVHFYELDKKILDFFARSPMIKETRSTDGAEDKQIDYRQ